MKRLSEKDIEALPESVRVALSDLERSGFRIFKKRAGIFLQAKLADVFQVSTEAVLLRTQILDDADRDRKNKETISSLKEKLRDSRHDTIAS